MIESVADRLDDKQAVIAELDEVTPGHAIFASDTASQSVTELADATARPDKVVGFRFARPIASNRLVEVVEGEYTSPETVQVAVRFAQTIRKSAIRCGDAPGYVVARVVISSLSEQWREFEDSGGPHLPLGAFGAAGATDLTDLLTLAERLRDAYGDRFHVPARLHELADSGDTDE